MTFLNRGTVSKRKFYRKGRIAVCDRCFELCRKCYQRGLPIRDKVLKNLYVQNGKAICPHCKCYWILV